MDALAEKKFNEDIETPKAAPADLATIRKQWQILSRMWVTRHRIGFKSVTERIAFYLQINPVFNLLFGFWFANVTSESSVFGWIAKGFVSRGLGYGALRHIPPEARTRFARGVLNCSLPSKSGDKASVIAGELEEKGFFHVPGFVSREDVEKAKAYFGEKAHYNAQIYAQSDGQEIRKDWRLYESGSPYRTISFKREDTLALVESRIQVDLKFLKNVADVYCGFDTKMYGVNTLGTLPGPDQSYSMRIHRDYDDFSSLTFFIAWTKTGDTDGATLFYPETHRRSDVKSKVIALCANPGDLMILDTFGLHAGNKGAKTPRLATWIRFGHTMNLATIQDGE